MKMLPEVDPQGALTGRQATVYALALIPAGLLPAIVGLAGGLYFVGALVLGVFYLAAAAPVLGVRLGIDRPAAAADVVSCTCPRSCCSSCSIRCRPEDRLGPVRRSCLALFRGIQSRWPTPPLSPTSTQPAAHGGSHAHDHHAPVTPGKVAMWLFLATEVMFFTGLIGSYIVLRSGSPSTSYTNLYPPTTDYQGGASTPTACCSKSAGSNPEEVEKLIRAAAPELKEQEAHEIVEEAREWTVVNHLTESQATRWPPSFRPQGAVAKVEPLVRHNWPKPYDRLTNPLCINLTAFNTFVLICSSVTMVLALAAIQQGNRKPVPGFPGATIVFGSFFLSIQISEYYELMFGRHYPPGISPTGHFRPDVSLFASCFFTMTGLPRVARHRGRDHADPDLHPDAAGRILPDALQPDRVRGPLLALRGPGLDHPVHDRLPDLIR